MGVVIFFLCLALAFWMYGSMSYLSKDVLRLFAILMGASAIFSYGFIKLLFRTGDGQTYLYLAFIPIFLFGFYYIKLKRKVRPLEVVANQQRYWDEVKAKDVYSFFQGRKQKKSKKITIRVNEEEKKLFRINPSDNKKYISTNFFKILKRIENEFTYVKSLKDIEQYELYNAVFNKIKNIVKSRDIDVDYEEIFKENKKCVEFFLMDLWERYTKRSNIGIANLVLLANREIEEEFVGALDNIDLNCVKAKGAALYYRYMVFSGREKNYISKQQEEIQEEIYEDGDFL